MSLINRSEVRKLALDLARERWGDYPCGQRVGHSFLERIEAGVNNFVRREVRAAPSKGKTLQ